MQLSGKKVAILAERDFQDLEVMYPYYRLKEAGAEVHVIGAGGAKEYKGKFGYPVKVDRDVQAVRAADYDAVVVPGGWAPDFMRRTPALIDFLREAGRQDKVIAAICHAGWMLASAGLLKGKKATSFSAIRDDMVNAGCAWVDESCVVDGKLITSRNPDDLPAFMRAVIGALS